MTGDMILISGSAATIGFVHTLLGPDHYLPFLAISRVKGWSGVQTATYVALCGSGHVFGTMLLCLVGLFFGIVVLKLDFLQSIRGDLAGWFLVFFGLFYAIWGILFAYRKGIGMSCGSDLSNKDNCLEQNSKVVQGLPWVLFLFFILGPCEPLIPLMMYQSSGFNLTAITIVALSFGVTSVFTMVALVMFGFYGLSKVSIPQAFKKFSHAFSGVVILMSGLAIQLLGL